MKATFTRVLEGGLFLLDLVWFGPDLKLESCTNLLSRMLWIVHPEKFLHKKGCQTLGQAAQGNGGLNIPGHADMALRDTV